MGLIKAIKKWWKEAEEREALDARIYKKVCIDNNHDLTLEEWHRVWEIKEDLK
jgi:hypothetical protein